MSPEPLPTWTSAFWVVLIYTKMVNAALSTLPTAAKNRLTGTGLLWRGPWVSASRAGWTNWPIPATQVMVPYIRPKVAKPKTLVA